MVEDQEQKWTEEMLSKYDSIRTFEYRDDFEWHTDEEDRTVTVMSVKGKWQFQYDNTKPIDLVEGFEFRIPRDEWHRILAFDIGSVLILAIHKHIES